MDGMNAVDAPSPLANVVPCMYEHHHLHAVENEPALPSSRLGTTIEDVPNNL
jgi:hypothetical protein|uniref:Uncharacterized protein K0098G01.1 n=1 Tax=Oryza sativa subsp. indica TaxID=39946 RepID=C8TF77_ORYSI|nr:hypothetical protein [Oryza sativa Indica Group]BAI39826.1 hypothetical protein [Oryza sativa Indica Group]